MKKIILLISLIFSLGLSAQSENPENKVLNDVVSDGKHEMKRQLYNEDGSLNSFVIARTNLEKGTYSEYYRNGTLKVFRIVK